MKKVQMLVALGSLLLLSIACNKFDNWWGHAKGGHGNKDLRLEEMKHAGRTYHFYYDHSGQVDSIHAVDRSNDYRYVVHRHGRRIDSVSLIQDGVYVSTNGNIQYDYRGRITSFVYNLYALPGFPPQTNTLTYDQRGNIETINGLSLNFNRDDDLIHWERGVFSAMYTHDDKLNPLHLIDDLFVMFVEERQFWEFIFSEHNSTRKTYDNDNFIVDYQNQYDAHSRLVKKTYQERSELPDSLELSYNW